MESVQLWRRAVDERSGREYFYHKETLETSWVAPVGMAVGEIPLRGISSKAVPSASDRARIVTEANAGENERISSFHESRDISLLRAKGDVARAPKYEYGFGEDPLMGWEDGIDKEQDSSTGNVKAWSAPSSVDEVPKEVISSSLSLLKKRLKSRPTGKTRANQKSSSTLSIRSSSATGAPLEREADIEKCVHCGRSFNLESLQKHEQVCQTVFQTMKKKKKTGGTQEKEPQNTPVKKTTWRRQSQEMRDAIGRSRNLKGTLTSTASSTTDSEASSGLIECPNCLRTFNAKAAERHIPVCESIRAKPKLLLRGSGKGAYSSTKMRKEAWGTGNSETSEEEKSGRRKSSSSSSEASVRRKSIGAVDTLKRLSVTENGVSLRECPHCARRFGYKAFERHVEYCSKVVEEREKQERVQIQTRNSNSHKNREFDPAIDENLELRNLEDMSEEEIENLLFQLQLAQE